MDKPKSGWFSSPVFAGNEEKTALARTIHIVQVYFLLALLFAAILTPFLVRPRQGYYIIMVVLLVVNGISRGIMLTGRLRLASLLVIASGWIVFGGMAVVSGGINSPLMYGILATSTVSGLLVDRRIGTMFVILGIFGGLALAVLPIYGIKLPLIFPLPTLATWMMFALATVFMHGYISLVVSNLQEALKRERLLSEAYRKANTTLQANEARFRTLAENAQDLIYRYRLGDTPGFEYVSPSATRLTGYTPEEHYADPQLGLKLIHPDDRSTLEAVMQTGGEPGKPIILRWVRKDGCILWVEQKNTPIMDEAGNLIAIEGSAADITERKQTEVKIQMSERKYRELFQVNKDGISIFLIDPTSGEGKFIEVNEAAHKMLGYTAEEMLANSPMAFEPDVTREQLDFRQKELTTHGIVNFETTLRHKDGHSVHAEFTSQLIHYQGGPAVMNIVRDITERKQHELELQAIAVLSSSLRTATTQIEMLPALVENIADLYKANAISIEIIDLESGDAVVEAAFGRWESIFGYRQKQGTGLNAIISRTLQPYFTQYQDESSQPEWLFGSVRCAAGVPLIAQEKLIGFLWIGRDIEIAPTEIRMLAAIADIAANAIHRSTLHEDALQAARDLSTAYDTTLEAWARALELRDQETEEHSQRVKEMTLHLARLYGLDEAALVQIRRGAILHDIGKIGIPDAILHKPGSLSADEWETMYKHPRVAYELLEPIRHLHLALDIPFCHHEKWDGSGYPRGLKGEEIPLAARIFAIVDVWDALRSDRPYRQKWPVEKVRDYIRGQSGIHFDPKIVELFLEMVGEGS